LYYWINTSGILLAAALSVQIHISSHDGVPIYLQIVNQVKMLVASGRLAAGEELPPIRTLAEKLLVNPNTVARAYRELEVAGIVTKRRTAGTYVSDAPSPLARRPRWSTPPAGASVTGAGPSWSSGCRARWSGGAGCGSPTPGGGGAAR
jgi:DNA-binding transcriptional regulator YhcF (GntR family)